MPSKNLVALTRRSYREDITNLLTFLTARGVIQISAVSLNHLKAYQAEMDNRGYAASSRNRKTQAIRIFFQSLNRLGLTSHNIAAELIPP
jgi:site-specific recombinase XerD